MAGRHLSDPETLAKAAAWTWYMRGNYGNVREGGCQSADRSRERRESRFKAEAMASSDLSQQYYNASSSSIPSTSSLLLWDCESELYDSFELLSISNRLNRTLSATPSISSSLARKDDGPLCSDLTRLNHDGHDYDYDVDVDGDHHHHGDLRRPKLCGFILALKKVTTNTIQKPMRPPKTYLDACRRHQHHHHHHYHHILHHHYHVECGPGNWTTIVPQLP